MRVSSLALFLFVRDARESIDSFSFQLRREDQARRADRQLEFYLIVRPRVHVKHIHLVDCQNVIPHFDLAHA